jgi:hypothetical protein
MSLKNILKTGLLVFSTALVTLVPPANANLSSDRINKTKFEDLIEINIPYKENSEISIKSEKDLEKLTLAYDIVKKINSPMKSQEGINNCISYSYQDLNKDHKTKYPITLRERKNPEKNSAIIQSFSETLDRKGGKCLDGGVAFIATLQDNKETYETKLVAIVLNEIEIDNHIKSHAIGIFKDKKTGLYGSGGINKSDYRFAKYKDLEKLIDSVANEIEDKKIYNHDYFIYDFSSIDLVVGTNNSLIVLEPFEILRKERGKYFHSSLKKQKEGFIHFYENSSRDIEATKYTKNFDKIFTVSTNHFTTYYRNEESYITSMFNKKDNSLIISIDKGKNKGLYIDKNLDGILDIYKNESRELKINIPYNNSNFPPNVF